MPHKIKLLYEFGDFRFDPEKKVLWRADEIVNLTPKPAEVLSLLIENHGNLLEREEILQRVWHDTFVEEGNLNHAVSTLRKALGNADFIQTVPRRGYRFTAPVNEVSGDADEIVFERKVFQQTLIEEHEETTSEKPPESLPAPTRYKRLYISIAAIFALTGVILLSAWFYGSGKKRAFPAAEKNPTTIAVLPLKSVEAEDEDLRFGLTENLVSRLGELDKVIVRPAATVNRLAETETDPLEIGRRLKADMVMTGSFQHSGSNIRLIARLLRVSDGAQVWSGNFDETEADVFKVEDSLAAQVASVLTDRLTPREKQEIAARPTEDFEAYKLYLRGRYAWSKRTAESLVESTRYFQAAIDRDPTFALAYGGLADSYVLYNDYAVAPPTESYPKAKAAAYRALEINPDLSEARTALAYVLATYEWNWAEAEREYRRVIEKNPNYATAHQWYGEMLYATKRYTEAEVELRRAGDLDPLAPIIQSELGVVKYYSGNYDESIAQFNKLKQDYPQFPTSYAFLSRCYEQKQLYDEAFAEEMVYWKLLNIDESIIGEMRRAYRNGGRRAYLEYMTAWLEKTVQTNYVYEYRMAHAFARLEDREKTLEWLERGVKNHSANIVKASIDPKFDFLRGEPRFQSIIKAMNLS